MIHIVFSLPSQIFYRLKFEKRLTNSAMPSVIGRAMDSIDFNGVYITEKTLKLVYERCPNLQSMSLKACGYLITDIVLQRLLKVSTGVDSCSLILLIVLLILFISTYPNFSPVRVHADLYLHAHVLPHVSIEL